MRARQRLQRTVRGRRLRSLVAISNPPYRQVRLCLTKWAWQATNSGQRLGAEIKECFGIGGAAEPEKEFLLALRPQIERRLSIVLNSVHKYLGRHAGHHEIAFSHGTPAQELGDTVDLIVVSAVRKRQQFMQQRREPIGFPRQVDMPRLDLGRLRDHAIRLAALRLLADWACHSLRQILPQILQQRHARPRILDQDRTGPMRRRELANLSSKVGILKSVAENV